MPAKIGEVISEKEFVLGVLRVEELGLPALDPFLGRPTERRETGVETEIVSAILKIEHPISVANCCKSDAESTRRILLCGSSLSSREVRS